MRTCISIRGDQLEQVTDFARAAGTNRSALMAEATLAYIAARKGQAKRNRHNHRATIEKMRRRPRCNPGAPHGGLRKPKTTLY